MKAILSADRNWGIGYQNKLLVRLPSDMRFFRETTTGHVVVMGRKTLESFPGGQPLKDRTNIVLTRDRNYRAPGAVLVHSLEELQKELEKYNSDEVYVIDQRLVSGTAAEIPVLLEPVAYFLSGGRGIVLQQYLSAHDEAR